MNLNDRRFYKVKKPVKEFICALCTSKREMKNSKDLSLFNYAQILLTSFALSYLLYPLIGAKVVFIIFIVWSGFEIVNKSLYRKELSCPYCGFDATWYRRDIKMAHKKVKEFWLQSDLEKKNAKVENFIADPSKAAVSHTSA